MKWMMGISTTRGGQYVVAKWGKGRDSKFLKIEVVMEKDEFKIVAEVTSNEVDSAVNTVKDLKEQGRGSMVIRLTILTRFLVL